MHSVKLVMKLTVGYVISNIINGLLTSCKLGLTLNVVQPCQLLRSDAHDGGGGRICHLMIHQNTL